MLCHYHRKVMRNLLTDNDGNNDDSNINYLYFRRL
jgi:hypothetical protein